MDQIMIFIHELQWIKKSSFQQFISSSLVLHKSKTKKRRINEKSKNEIWKECFLKPIAGLSLLKSYASDFTNNVFEKLIEKEMLKLKNAKRKRM